jgi:CheY-like chemotaxis protein
LESYDAEAFNTRKQKTSRRKKFDEKNSRFAANVLVAEDNVINQKLIKRTLEDLGLTVTLANNGLEAFEKRKNGEFDLIFMDIQMPVLDGLEATQEILDFEEDYDQHHIPIIALTANALKGDRERFMAAGMDEYTTKPLVRSDIISLLNNFLSHKIIDLNIIPKSADELVGYNDTNESNASNDREEIIQIKPLDEEVLVENTLMDDELEIASIANEENEVESHNDETLVVESVPETSESGEAPTIHESAYDADILIAKQSPLEMKLFTRILDDLGYTYVSVNNVDELYSNVQSKRYKVALFDKGLASLNLKELSDIIRENDSDISLIMLVDPSLDNDKNDTLYVHEMIKNIVNKDLLRLVFEKFI